MCLLSSVEFLRFACRNDAVWFLYIEVVFCRSDVRFSSAINILSLRVTVAW